MGFRGDQALNRLLEYPDIKTVLDIGSGAGEHAQMMRAAGLEVTTISLTAPADVVGPYQDWTFGKKFDAIWACHVLEHQVDPGAFLRKCREDLRPGGYLFVTVPPAKNEVVGGHVSIWNAGLLLYHLILAGFDCVKARVGTYGYNISVIVANDGDAGVPWRGLEFDAGDIDKLMDAFPIGVKEGFDGRIPNVRWTDWDDRETLPPPRHVAIVGLGPSADQYIAIAKKFGDRRLFADQVWGINAIGSVIQCDLVFHMDDVRIQQIRADAAPQSNIAAMLNWLRTYPGPVMTSRAHADFPNLIEFPLADVITKLGRGYFNSTAAYAVAYAVYLGAERISLWGFDFTYPDSHKAERGRACVEFWMGYAAKAGIEISLPPQTTLMDSFEDSEDEATLYGYDTVRLQIEMTENGGASVTMTPRDELPTAEEIEAAYDHGKHPLAQRRDRK